MSIEFRCTNCSRLLRVADEHAGMPAQCPKCNTELTVPPQTQLSDVVPRESDASATPMSQAPPDRTSATPSTSPADSGRPWYVHLPSGQRAGPLQRAELDQWIADGRLNRECQVLEEGWEQWKWADEVFPGIGNAGGGQTPVSNNPYASPQSASGQTGTMNAYLKPHRGGLILTFGILSLLSCMFSLLCSVFGFVGFGFSISAWIMANADLREIRGGTMDPSGEGQTSVGRILSIIHIVLSVVLFLIGIVFLVVVIALEEM